MFLMLSQTLDNVFNGSDLFWYAYRKEYHFIGKSIQKIWIINWP